MNIQLAANTSLLREQGLVIFNYITTALGKAKDKV